jgi:hypothetical protein
MPSAGGAFADAQVYLPINVSSYREAVNRPIGTDRRPTRRRRFGLNGSTAWVAGSEGAARLGEQVEVF